MVLFRSALEPIAVLPRGRVAVERKGANRRIVFAGGIIDQRGCSVCRVALAGGVQQERCSARRRIGVSRVEHKRSSANTGVEAAGRDALERKPPDCCVGSATSEAKKGVLSFRRRKVGIAAIRRRDNCSRDRRKHKATDRRNYGDQ